MMRNVIEGHLKLELEKEGVTDNAIIQNIEKEVENKEVISPIQVSILVAEDDVFYFSYIESILLPLNFKLYHAKDGDEAVNIYRSIKDIKLILMDLQMPIMDGYTAIKEIRKTDMSIPIIAQTSLNMNGARGKAIFLGCNDFLLKPVTSGILTMKIEHYLKINNSETIPQQ